jgi:hypothetical protein
MLHLTLGTLELLPEISPKETAAPIPIGRIPTVFRPPRLSEKIKGPRGPHFDSGGILLLFFGLFVSRYNFLS